MDSGEIKKRLRQTVDRVRRESVSRREAIDDARRAWEGVLEQATPLARQFVQALRAEGAPFTLGTPAGALRLDADRRSSDYIALTLDTARRPPAVVGQVSHTRGQHVIVSETVVADGAAIAAITEEQILAYLLDAVVPFVE
jgi:hypothetical protein